MDDRFEKLTTNVAQIHKSIQKIKKIYMQSQGLKSTHVMCLYYLSDHPDGLTAAGLCELCKEDKAGISRILSDLENRNFIAYEATRSSAPIPFPCPSDRCRNGVCQRNALLYFPCVRRSKQRYCRTAAEDFL